MEEGNMGRKTGVFRELIGCYRFAHEIERAVDDILLHMEHGGDGRAQTIIRRADGSIYYGLEMLCEKLREYQRKALLLDELQKGKN